MKMELKETGLEGMDWINSTQEKASGGVVMKMAIKLQVLQMQGISCLAVEVLASQEGLCSMETVI